MNQNLCEESDVGTIRQFLNRLDDSIKLEVTIEKEGVKIKELHNGRVFQIHLLTERMAETKNVILYLQDIVLQSFPKTKIAKELRKIAKECEVCGCKTTLGFILNDQPTCHNCLVEYEDKFKINPCDPDR